ncbi:uncharacterized protein TNCV_3595081 [Trichonephila clavipes]|nr:uncharacterized protein TNCV_3595081 [Trichonephila clavipes]
MMEAGWSAMRIARQLSRSECVVRRYWDEWIKQMPFTRRPGSGRLQQTSRRKDRHIIRNARVRLNPSSVTIQVHVVLSLGPLCHLEPNEGAWLKDIYDRDAHYVCCH